MFPADTIAAIATAPGRAGIGVVRVSGSRASVIAQAVTGRTRITPRRATLSVFLDAEGRALDEGIALFFSAPNSYTGEDVLELQGHGGPAVLRLLLQRCIELGARAAQPGEFTRRAYVNDKLDLAQAEAVADLIEASSAAAARGAMRSLSGAFSKEIGQLREALIALRAYVEAMLDFPEEDVELLERGEVVSRLQAIRHQLAGIIQKAKQGNLLREGARAVLLGRPNVGKSSLMNVLAEEEVALVTDIPGTTRDALKREINVGGIPLHLVDTAGLRESQDPIERLGVERSWHEVRHADVLIHVYDASLDAQPHDLEIDRSLPPGLKKIRIFNKIDLTGASPHREMRGGELWVWASAKTAAGVDLVREALLEALGWEASEEAPYMARERHLAALGAAATALERAGEVRSALELFAEELRAAQTALSEITGEFSADDLLGEIFSRFCIGK
jgi:tRNA modification GTPase